MFPVWEMTKFFFHALPDSVGTLHVKFCFCRRAAFFFSSTSKTAFCGAVVHTKSTPSRTGFEPTTQRLRWSDGLATNNIALPGAGENDASGGNVWHKHVWSARGAPWRSWFQQRHLRLIANAENNLGSDRWTGRRFTTRGGQPGNCCPPPKFSKTTSFCPLLSKISAGCCPGWMWGKSRPCQKTRLLRAGQHFRAIVSVPFINRLAPSPKPTHPSRWKRRQYNKSINQRPIHSQCIHDSSEDHNARQSRLYRYRLRQSFRGFNEMRLDGKWGVVPVKGG